MVTRVGVLRAVLALLGLVALSAADPARAEKKVALLIGNAAYSHVPALRNPGNDVALMARTLKEAGFDTVETVTDLDDRTFRQTLRRFELAAGEADVGLVYYSGHGLEMNGQNYLVPVNAQLASDIDVNDEAIPLDRVLQAVDRVKRLKLIILDACRDNPFVATMQRTAGTRSVGRGLARVEPSSTGTLIAYAAKAGTTASDGAGANSPFAAALAKHIARPGLDVRLALGNVRDEVMTATNQKQEPFVYGSLGGSTLALGPAEAPKPAPAPVALPAPAPPMLPPVTADTCQYAGAHWAQAEKLDRTEFYEEHLRLFPTCPFAGFAKLRLADKSKPAAPQVAALPAAAPPATPPQAAPARSLTEGDLARSIQLELKRVGCDPGRIDGSWSAATRGALTAFNTHGKAKLDTRTAAVETLELLRERDERVCPLACATGTRASGEQCVPIICGPGQQLSSRGVCVAAPQAAPRPATRTSGNAGQVQPSAPAPAPAPAPTPAGRFYDAPQSGMSCTMFGSVNTGGSLPNPPVRMQYFCK